MQKDRRGWAPEEQDSEREEASRGEQKEGNCEKTMEIRPSEAITIKRLVLDSLKTRLSVGRGSSISFRR